MRSLLPAALAGIFGCWCGTLIGGAGWGGAAVAQLAALASLAALGGGDGLDPLRLGRWGRWLPLVLVATACASLLASPVPRAGRAGLLLLPAFLLVPAGVARVWRGERAQAVGLRAVAAVVGAVAAWSLLAWALGWTPRPAAPLGHHLLLASWLVTLLPLAARPAFEHGRWRWLGGGAALLGMAAVLASRSLVAGLALGLEAALLSAAVRHRFGRARMLGVAVLLLGTLAVAAAPRLVRIGRGEDASVSARATYLAAGWRGFAARPLLGWGPGSTPWTAARFVAPIPGVNPPGEAVGELHSLPVQLLYELGLAGASPAAALVALFLLRRWRELRDGGSPLRLAGLLGLAGGGVCALGTAAVTVTALPLAAALAAGAALSGAHGAVPSPRRRAPVALPALYAVLAAGLLLPAAFAHRSYDRALAASWRASSPAELLRQIRVALADAVRWDPAFPLYRGRLAAHRAVDLASRRAAAEEALAAARAAHSVAALWTQAGVLGQEVRAPWTPFALERACATAPLDATAPLYLALFDPGAGAAPHRAARALAAEPRLAAATWWEHHPDLFAAARGVIRGWDQLDAGWREAFGRATARLERARSGGITYLELGREQGTAPFSLHLFRRRPWPAPLVRVPVRAALLSRVALPPATTLHTTAAAAFHGARCGAPLAVR